MESFMKKLVLKKITILAALGFLFLLSSCKKADLLAPFKKNANNFNRELALLSFDASSSTISKSDAEAFFTEKLHFDTFEYSEDYNVPASINTIGYVFAHTVLGDNDLIAITVRGFDYGAEWAGNFRIGRKGNHANFASAAEKIYADLLAYRQKHFPQAKLKLWLSGFSRGGGVANVLAHFILSREDFDVSQNNMFVYTVEAPQALIEDNAHPYPNVFNIINSADIITVLAPNAYDLYRCGNDVDIYSPKIDKFMKEANLPLVPFTPIRTEDTTWFFKAETEVEFLNGLLTKLMEEQPAGFPSFATREFYADTVQDDLCYLVERFINVPQEDLDALLASFKGFFQVLYSEQADTLTGSLQMIMHSTGLFGKMIAILTSNSISYKDEQLQKAFMTVVQIALTKKEIVAGCMTYLDNLKRLGQMHDPSTIRVLLEHYED